jgi:hypothetical protein
MASSTSHRAWHDRRRELALWTGILAGPIVFLFLLEANYVLAYVACETRQKWFLHLTTAVALGVVAGAGWVAWRNGPPDDSQRRSYARTPETTETRARWMAIAAIASCGFFLIVILATEIPVLVHNVCD